MNNRRARAQEASNTPNGSGLVRASSTSRARWAGVGAAVAIAVGAGGLLSASASNDGVASALVPITPCRLVDSRSDQTVGPRATPLGSGETYSPLVWGSNGNCTIPATATGVSLNVAIVNPSSGSFLTVFPSDQTQPLASNLNWVAHQAPTPNAVTARLSADGHLSFYNLAGTVDVVVDVVGYYIPSLSGSGPAGPPGPKGDPGTPGLNGTNGATPTRVLWVATSNGDYKSVNDALAAIGTTLPANDVKHPYVIRIAPGTYTETQVTLKDYVDLDGSGQNTTTISCSCGSSAFAASSATMVASGASLHVGVRNLHVLNTAASSPFVATAIYTNGLDAGASFDHVTATTTGSQYGIGFFNEVSSPTMTDDIAEVTGGSTGWALYNNSASPMMTNITATATGASSQTTAVYNSASSPMMTDITATATGASSNIGVLNSQSNLTMTNVTASASGGTADYGVFDNGGTVLVRDSFLAGGTNSVNQGSGTVRILNTKFLGATLGVGATHCVGAMDPALSAFTCV